MFVGTPSENHLHTPHCTGRRTQQGSSFAWKLTRLDKIPHSLQLKDSPPAVVQGGGCSYKTRSVGFSYKVSIPEEA